jgi:AcrR family transcriptional regulator
MVRYILFVPPRRATAAREDPPPRRLDVDERRRQLVALGMDLFSTRPYDDVSIDELARAAGISKGLLYHYFPTKRDFYVATVREGARQLLERTRSASEGGPGEPLERLRAGLDAFLDYVAQHGPAYAALLRSGVGADVEVARIVDETRETFCTRLLEGAPAPPIEVSGGALVHLALRGWLGFVEAATIEWLGGRRQVRREALRELLVQALATAVQASTAT